MTARSEQMKAVLQRYVDGLNACDADAVLALFAPDAEIEDPVGTPVRRGAEIEAWFRAAVETEPRLELSAPIRGSRANAAAMAFTVTSTRDGQQFQTQSIDVMRFDDEGRIVRLDGYWGSDDRRRV